MTLTKNWSLRTQIFVWVLACVALTFMAAFALIATQTRQAYLGVVSGIAQVKALRQALTSSESVLEASKLGQEVGVRTNLDVLNAQQQLFSTRRDLYQAEYNYLVSQLRLKAAVGSLGEEDMARVNQALY